MNKIKTGDQVIVIAGKDKGKQGSVTKILSNGRCYVSGVQMVKDTQSQTLMPVLQGAL